MQILPNAKMLPAGAFGITGGALGPSWNDWRIGLIDQPFPADYLNQPGLLHEASFAGYSRIAFGALGIALEQQATELDEWWGFSTSDKVFAGTGVGLPVLIYGFAGWHTLDGTGNPGFAVPFRNPVPLLLSTDSLTLHGLAVVYFGRIFLANVSGTNT